MFAVENVMKVFPLLEELEKENYRFSQEEKQALYRVAFHTESFEEVRDAVLQMAVYAYGAAERQELLGQYTESLPESPSDDAVQIEGYIFQLQHMCYEKEKAMGILEDILKRNGISKETDDRALQPEGQPTGKGKGKEADIMAMEPGEKPLKSEETKEADSMNNQAGAHPVNKNERGRTMNGRPR